MTNAYTWVNQAKISLKNTTQSVVYMIVISTHKEKILNVLNVRALSF
jgi:hypothetical protein